MTTFLIDCAKNATRKPPKLCPTGRCRQPFFERDLERLYGWGAEEEGIDKPVPFNGLTMCELSAMICDKPNWWEKYKDPAICAKWKKEEDEIDYVLDELEGYTAVRDPETGIEVDFLILQDGKNVKSLGYITNDAVLHTVIKTLVAHFIPLWSRVLVKSKEDYKLPLWTHTGYGSHDWEPADLQYYHLHSLPDIPTHEEFDAMEEAWKAIHVMRYPGLLEAYQTGFLGFPEPMNLKGKKLQVIVKLANILLTLEKPVYKGGSWHIEGMKNECIISTGIYYYDQENITQSKLSFCTNISEPKGYSQNDGDATMAVWGLDQDKPLNQVVTEVSTKVAHCIAFPNMYQHCVSPFSLLDLSKLGYRKIVALFLVDPKLENLRLSTMNVLPQHQDWWSQELLGLAVEGNSQLGLLPIELLDIVMEFMDLMMRKEAEELRLQLMDE
ncbi:hypothetical protein EDD85DRAFT_970166 [Armillaria nabsnona]|nr:hypothetical protein EDD85DRAFT_970166 [Armillaria nabsnona]